MHTRPLATLAALAALLAGAVLLATPAWAHDKGALSTDPSTGQSVAGVPAEVVLTFAEPPLELGMAVQVIGPGGTDVAAGPPTPERQCRAPGDRGRSPRRPSCARCTGGSPPTTGTR